MSARSLPPVVPVAALRVYEPAEVFPADQGVRWAGELGRPDAAERAHEAERRESWRRLIRGARGRAPVGRPAADGAGDGVGEGSGDGVGEGSSGDRAGDGAGDGAGPTGGGDGDPLAGYVRVLRADGGLLLCPASLGGGDGPRRTLVRAWELPPPWLAVVALAAVRDPGHSGEPGRYLAPMARARAQAARTLRTVRDQLEGTETGLELELLARWLEGFHPRSWVELDVRAVTAVLPAGGDPDATADDGLEDVRLVLECLGSGDAERARAAYQRLGQRSRALTDISRLS